MGLFDTYGAANRQVLAGKTQRITSEPIGDPTVTVTKQTDGKYTAETVQWYKCTCVCSARYAYVGMTYDAATTCAEAMRQKWTRNKLIWEYNLTVNQTTKTFSFEWQSRGQGTVLDTEISLEYVGGSMWQVVVSASTTDDKYVTDPSGVTFAYPTPFNDVD